MATAVGVWIPEKGTWIGAAGIADLKANAPASKNMIWPLRSITKSFTGTHYLVDAKQWPEPHAVGYEPVDGVLTPQPANLSIYGPAGAMVSNLDDMRVWVKALATGSLLKQATQSER